MLVHQTSQTDWLSMSLSSSFSGYFSPSGSHFQLFMEDTCSGENLMKDLHWLQQAVLDLRTLLHGWKLSKVQYFSSLLDIWTYYQDMPWFLSLSKPLHTSTNILIKLKKKAQIRKLVKLILMVPALRLISILIWPPLCTVSLHSVRFHSVPTGSSFLSCQAFSTTDSHATSMIRTLQSTPDSQPSPRPWNQELLAWPWLTRSSPLKISTAMASWPDAKMLSSNTLREAPRNMHLTSALSTPSEPSRQSAMRTSHPEPYPGSHPKVQSE